ncbi:hypothetical protein B7Z17_02775 [Candidatus Saccharibacteria bacterium 32-49-10]|nr:MAG: hypothetical protein B7Z17_02775 [Candidatus Saccharibacteria bacterium 32-49-10]
MHKIDTGRVDAASVVSYLRSVGIKPSTNSYSEGFVSNGTGNNLIVCSTSDGASFAVVAWSKSGNGFAYRGGGVREHPYTPATYTTTCPQAGISLGSSNWLYAAGSWKI